MPEPTHYVAFGQRRNVGDFWQEKLVDALKLGRYPDLIPRETGVGIMVDKVPCRFSPRIVCSSTETWAGFRLWRHGGVTETIAQKAWKRLGEILLAEGGISIGEGKLLPYMPLEGVQK